MRLGAKKPRPVNHVGLAVQNRFEQDSILRRIILEVGILNDHDFPARLLETRAQCRALALIHLVAEQANPLVTRRDLAQHLQCIVLRTIVDNDQLLHRRLARTR